MELTFYQKEEQPDGDGRLMIHGRICWQGRKVRFSTSEKIRATEFDPAKQEVRGRVKFASHINQTLSTYRSELNTFFYARQNSAQETTEADVRAELTRIRVSLLGKKKLVDTPVEPPAPILPSLSLFPAIYTAEMKADRSPEWRQSVMTVGGQLQTFRPNIDWKDLTINTLNQFKVYLQEEEGLADNTIHTYISLLRGMCKYAEKTGIVVPRGYAWVETRPGEVIRPVLEPYDEQKIVNASLTPCSDENFFTLDYLERVRWYFLLACQTGLRQSDQWQFLNPQITHIENVPCLMALQQKTGKRVAIPLNDDTYYLLRNPVTKQKPPRLDMYNLSLKTLGEQSELTRQVTVGSFYKGELLADVLPLHDAMSSHLARHTFATRMTEGGMDTFTLKEIMGHKSVTSTQRYQSAANPVIVQHTLEAWRRQKANTANRIDPTPLK